MKTHNELYHDSKIYKFITNEIGKVESQIRDNANAISKLSKMQAELNRGRAWLLQSRRELVEAIKND